MGYSRGMKRLVFLDTETTGISNPRLVELCYHIEKAPSPVWFRCKPPLDIEIGATVVNGIRTKDVATLLPFTDMPWYQETKELLESNTIVAHNAIFDIRVLENEGIFVKDFICTKELAKVKWPESESHSLQYLRYWLDLDVNAVAHSGIGDVVVLMVLWDKLHGK